MLGEMRFVDLEVMIGDGLTHQWHLHEDHQVTREQVGPAQGRALWV